MRVSKLKVVLIFVLSLFSLILPAQSNKKGVKEPPASFTISKSDFDKLIHAKEKVVIKSKNEYINNSQLVFKSTGGDMSALRFKLSYFPTSFLMIQINGKDSRQVFVTSEENGVFYKSREEKGKYMMTKCTKDEIVSE